MINLRIFFFSGDIKECENDIKRESIKSLSNNILKNSATRICQNVVPKLKKDEDISLNKSCNNHKLF